jgi:hypothetical protein
MLPRTTSIWQRDSQPNASGKPGAVHIDLIGSGYGIVTMLVVLSFVLSVVQPRMSAKAVTILLFIIGSLLSVGGALSLITAIDRIALRTGTPPGCSASG